jgi:hypothetical protein
MAAFLLSLLLCAVAVVGCGGAKSGDGSDPAAAVPAGALGYIEVTLRPDGQVKEDALDAAGKILDASDPGPKLRELVDKLIAEADTVGTTATYARDVEPWLGERAGLWFAAEITSDEDAVGAVIAVSDADGAQEFIEREAEKTDKPGSYRDVDYLLSTDDTAIAVVDDRLLVGHLPQFKQMVDLLRGEGAELAGADAYEKAIDPLSDGRLGHLYIELGRLIELALQSDPDAAMLKGFLPKGKFPPVGVGFLANGDRLAFEAVTETKGGDSGILGLSGLGGGASSPLLGELPGDAWGAFAAKDVGKAAKAMFEELAGALGGAAIAAQFREQTGLDLEQDVFSWIGDVAVFVRGTSMEALEGALVIESTDDARATKTFGAVAALLAQPGTPRPIGVDGAESAFSFPDTGLPKPLVLARAEGRVVLAVGQQAASDAISPGAKLGDSDAYQEAKESLGEGIEPGLIVSVPAVLELAEALGATDDPDYAKAKPYLDAFSVLAAGSKLDDDHARSILSLGFE